MLAFRRPWLYWGMLCWWWSSWGCHVALRLPATIVFACPHWTAIFVDPSTNQLPLQPKMVQNITKTQMSPKLKCHQNWNDTKTEMSPKLNVTKAEMSIKLKCHRNWNVTRTEMLPKLKCHQNWNVTETEISLKLKYYQHWNVTKTEKSPKLIYHQKKKSLIQKFH